MTSRRPPARTVLTIVIAAVLSCLLLGACSSGSNDSGTSSDSAAAGAPAAGEALGSAASSVDSGVAGSDQGGQAGVTPVGLTRGSDLAGSAIIKTADVSMQADDVASVVDKITALTAGLGGRVASQNTSSDAKGNATNAYLEVQVPVDTFEASVDKIATFGTHVDQSTSTEDVTAKVADVDSRVRSAEDSIAQLRRLFTRATKLGDVIALENELSQREADLEALQAEQRVLQARTTMSTISVDVTHPDTKQSPSTDAASDGFVSGIKRGWDALATFVLAVAHTLGLVLPIATLLLLVAAMIWFGVRRLTPSRRTAAQGAPVAPRE
ncbi:MAG: DUF4349 domain-containing protein [Nocardioidaceae bacterium]